MEFNTWRTLFPAPRAGACLVEIFSALQVHLAGRVPPMGFELLAHKTNALTTELEGHFEEAQGMGGGRSPW